MPRIEPLSPPYSPQAEELLTSMMPASSPVPPLALFRVMGRNLSMAEAAHVMGKWMLRRRPKERDGLTVRDREIAILRTCGRCRCEYEWGVHVAFFAERVGISAAQANATARPELDGEAGWSGEDRQLLEAVDAMCGTGTIPAQVWEALAARWPPEDLLELTMLVGWYHAIAYTANAAQVPLEPWAARFPEP